MSGPGEDNDAGNVAGEVHIFIATATAALRVPSMSLHEKIQDKLSLAKPGTILVTGICTEKVGIASEFVRITLGKARR